MDSEFMRHLHLLLQVVFPVTVVWEPLLSFISHVTHPWRDLFWFCVNIYLTMWAGIGSISMKFVLLPVRIYTAMQRADTIEKEMAAMQNILIESENRNTELESKLEQTLADCKHLEDLLKVAETERKAFLKKYQILQLRVIDLEEENESLRALDEKISKGLHDRDNVIIRQKDVRCIAPLKRREDNIPSYKEEKISKVMHERKTISSNKNIGCKDNIRCEHSTNIPARKVVQTNYLEINSIKKTPDDKLLDRAKQECREAALLSSLFSVFLSLLVGTVAWQAQDPCTPLVLAVFIVVCLSLRTVMQFLLCIGSGLGIDALVLLSFNWFLLGTLAFPLLPNLAGSIAPVASNTWQCFMNSIGFSHIIERLAKF